MYNNRITVLLTGLFCLSACTGETDADGDSAAPAPDTAEDLISIPDPGADYAPDRWYDDGAYHGTPETAQTMGIALMSPNYVQGGIDPETGNHFFVFKTAPDLTEFDVDLRNQSSDIQHVHIHEGNGLVFGDEVPATEVFGPTEAEWELEGDTIYVLEVHSPQGGFF